MTEPATHGERWDAVFRPRVMPRLAVAGAVLMVLIGVGIALTLRDKSTGPTLRTADQWAMLLLSVIFAGITLLLLRPRLRVGPAGLGVRNIVEERVIPWNQVVGLSFPRRWLRIEIPGNEYIPVVAVQSLDKDRAVAAMDSVRELMDRYRA